MTLNKEPVLIITTIVTIVVGAIATLTGNGFISDAAAGKATDVANSIGQLLVLLAPIIAGIIARGQVYSPATVQEVAKESAATGNPTVTVTPP
jgi:hypothetical protein